jgi:hypothetical protein
MTTPWTPTGEWQGATAAVLGAGPSLTPDIAEALRSHFVIAVNAAVSIAPWADMLVALDAGWPAEWREFPGMRVTGIEDADLDAFYVGHRFHRVRTAGGEIEIRNSGLEAIRIAAEMGASRIILVGFEPERPGYFYDDEVDTADFHVGVAEGLQQITAALAARGVVVERYAPEATALPDAEPEA